MFPLRENGKLHTENAAIKVIVVIVGSNIEGTAIMFSQLYEIFKRNSIAEENIYIVILPKHFDFPNIIHSIGGKFTCDVIIILSSTMLRVEGQKPLPFFKETLSSKDLLWLAFYRNTPVVLGIRSLEGQWRREELLERGGQCARIAIQMVKCSYPIY